MTHFTKKIAYSLLSVVALSLTPQLAVAQKEGATKIDRQDQIRTAMVFNFARFADWPEKPTSGDLTLCLSRDADIAGPLLALSGREVKGRRLNAVLLDNTPVSECDLAYLSSSDAASDKALELLLAGSLTISSQRGFSDDGVIELVRIGRQLRFSINNSNAKKASISLSSKLLRIAVEVK
ncbi:MAG: YfiR family protein [Hyphomonas sp.]